MYKIQYVIFFIVISILLSACAENVKSTPAKSLENYTQFDYFENTKGKPKSEVVTIINPTKKNLNGLRIYKIGRKKVPSNGVLYQGKDIVVASGIKFLHIQHSGKEFRFMAILAKGKTYILGYTSKYGENTYHIKEQLTGEKITLSHIDY